ncbi:SDR family NAD(P)-dependent oxidoreductase [Streptomyces luteireticuli]|uniref:SDR family NAD(P)-dependent oxidoreductase n=1 Tax=Streptomyces luteireticuli TaxID=173858 RepID=UPI0035571CEC
MTRPQDAPVTLVVGGSSNTGAAVVHRLHTDGHRILATHHQHPDRAHALTTRLDPHQHHLAFTGADLTDPTVPERLVGEALDRYGRLDTVVHCAAIIDTTPLDQLTADRFDAVLHTNVTAPFLILRAAADQPTLRAAVTVSSIAATYTGPDSPAYEASKAALAMLTRSLAAAYAPRIRINAVAPGTVETERSLADPTFPRRMLCEHIPLRRLAAPTDIASVIAFLLGGGAAYLTGQVITADGGLSLHLTRPVRDPR